MEIFALFSLFTLLVYSASFNINTTIFLLITLISIVMPTILDYLNYIIFKKDGIKKQKTFEKNFSVLQGSFLRGIIGISLVPHKAYISFNAIIKTLYRMYISKENLLEWTTSEEAEQILKTSLYSFYKEMFINVIAGFLSVLLIWNSSNLIIKIPIYILAVLWIFGPMISWKISKKNKEKDMSKKLSNEDKEYILEVGKRTWKFFELYMNEENNFLPPDNFQEDRKNKIVNRTSSTNIGLGLLSIISAFDLGYISEEECINLLEKSINTISNLSKWNGHLYNWYNTKTLQPLIPRYISSVDSGNFIRLFIYIKKIFRIKGK